MALVRSTQKSITMHRDLSALQGKAVPTVEIQLCPGTCLPILVKTMGACWMDRSRNSQYCVHSALFVQVSSKIRAQLHLPQTIWCVCVCVCVCVRVRVRVRVKSRWLTLAGSP